MSIDRRKGPQTIEAFLKRPTRARWRLELAAGWPGPDGSSDSTDTIMGVRIGITSRDYRYVDLPANRHDWLYRLARRYRLPDEWRQAADALYRDLCLARCREELTGWRRWTLLPIAITRCHARYVALRVGARFAWTGKAALREERWSGEAV